MTWHRHILGLALTGAFLSVLPVAASAAPGPLPTVTTLAASTTSSASDSWVTFTVQVSASKETPTGSVTFSDTSNGSALDTVALSNGAAAFSTAALAVGTRTIVASYAGNSTFSPSSSSAVSLSVAPAGSLAVAYQVDARHDGRQARGALSTGSLIRKWSRTLGGTNEYGQPMAVSYPVIARGRVFVLAQESGGLGIELYALNAGTGATAWSADLGYAYFSALTYDGQRIFDLNSAGVLTAFAASTGQELWAIQIPYEWYFTAPPTAYDGVVYVSGGGTGGRVYGISEADHQVRWSGWVENGDTSSPAVDNSGVYVSYVGPQDYRFTLGGQLVWRYSGCCEGGGGSTAVLHGSYDYARGAGADIPLILSKSSGAAVGTFASPRAPAFDSTNMYTLSGGKLVASDPSGSTRRWVFGDGSLVTAPVVNNGVVYVGNSSGTVYGVSASSGTKLWSRTAGPSISADEYSPVVLAGLTVGGGLLVVPAGSVLTAFGD